MAQVLRQRQWRLIVSLLALVAWLLGTNFCALGLMARPCSAVAPKVSASCPYCPAKPSPEVPVTPTAAPCCQEVRAELPPATVGLPAPLLSSAAVGTDWADAFSLALVTMPEAAPTRAFPDTGPPAGERAVAMRILLGRCAPVHAPPTLG